MERLACRRTEETEFTKRVKGRRENITPYHAPDEGSKADVDGPRTEAYRVIN